MDDVKRSKAKKNNDTFGINMKEFFRSHEAFVESEKPSRKLLEIHLEKLRWLQHERLIHLIVTVMVVFGEIFLVYLVVLHPELGVLPALLMLGIAILLGFYFYHYFFLENTVQRWYTIAEELLKQITGEDDD